MKIECVAGRVVITQGNNYLNLSTEDAFELAQRLPQMVKESAELLAASIQLKMAELEKAKKDLDLFRQMEIPSEHRTVR